MGAPFNKLKKNVWGSFLRDMVNIKFTKFNTCNIQLQSLKLVLHVGVKMCANRATINRTVEIRG